MGANRKRAFALRNLLHDQRTVPRVIKVCETYFTQLDPQNHLDALKRIALLQRRFVASIDAQKHTFVESEKQVPTPFTWLPEHPTVQKLVTHAAEGLQVPQHVAQLLTTVQELNVGHEVTPKLRAWCLERLTSFSGDDLVQENLKFYAEMLMLKIELSHQHS